MDNAHNWLNLILNSWIPNIAVFIACFLFLLSKIERLESKFEAKFEEQTARTDRLYEIVIELLKQHK